MKHWHISHHLIKLLIVYKYLYFKYYYLIQIIILLSIYLIKIMINFKNDNTNILHRLAYIAHLVFLMS